MVRTLQSSICWEGTLVESAFMVCIQLALDDLVKAPSNKLFPFVKLLLAENLLLETSDAAGESASVQVDLVRHALALCQ